MHLFTTQVATQVALALSGSAPAILPSQDLDAGAAQSPPVRLAFADLTGDGLDDVIAQAPNGEIRLLENLGAAGFADVTAERGLGGVGFATCVLIQDLDGDGHLDLFLGSWEQRLWRNQGGGSFVPFKSDLRHDEVDFGATAKDMDGDGQVDVQVATQGGTRLYRSLGEGHFEEVTLPLNFMSSPGAAPSPPSGGSVPGRQLSGGVASTDRKEAAANRLSTWLLAASGSRSGGTAGPSSFGPTFTSIGPAMAATSSGICAETIVDQATGTCIEADSNPTLGSLYPMSTKFNVAPSGAIGIGTGTPEANIHIERFMTPLPTVLVRGDGPRIRLDDTRPGVEREWVMRSEAGDLKFTDFTADANRLTIRSNGTVEVGKVLLPTFLVRGDGPRIRLDDRRPGSEREWVMRSEGGDLKFTDFTADANRLTIRANGLVSVAQSLEIRGGADIVERFNAGEELEPGTVVVIDPANPGKLMHSSEAYDVKVAGVVSGAGGVNPGLCLSQDGALDGDTLVAMNGRVYVKATAANGAIQPGDLLTSSDLEGRAMKATDHARAFGTVIGKAMSSLEFGEGLVLVLVNLQ